MKKAQSRELFKKVVKNEQRKAHTSQSLEDLRDWQIAKREFMKAQKAQNTFITKMKKVFKK